MQFIRTSILSIVYFGRGCWGYKGGFGFTHKTTSRSMYSYNTFYLCVFQVDISQSNYEMNS